MINSSVNHSATLAVPKRPPFRVGPLSLVWRPQAVGVSLILLCAIVFLAAISIGVGEYPVSPLRVLEVLLTGQGSRAERLVVLDWRMPRALTAIFVGCALGLSGALTQSVARNALALDIF